jgi:hypothetical protein
MNSDEISKRFPQASATVIRLNATDKAGGTGLQDGDVRPAAVLERHTRDGAVGEVPVQKGIGGSFLVRVTAIRKRLLDQDNLCEKYLVDLCRYAGIIPGDSPATTQIEVCQQKAEPGQAEFVRIEIFRR